MYKIYVNSLEKEVNTKDVETLFKQNVSQKSLEDILFYAIYHGHINMVNMMIQKGINVNCRGKYDITPLYVTSISVIGILMDEHDLYDDNGPGLKNGETVCANRIEIAKALLDSGADVNLASTDQITPLINAASYKYQAGKELYEKLIEVYISYGADKTKETQQHSFGHPYGVTLILSKCF